jgi:hypothetical protein
VVLALLALRDISLLLAPRLAQIALLVPLERAVLVLPSSPVIKAQVALLAPKDLSPPLVKLIALLAPLVNREPPLLLLVLTTHSAHNALVVLTLRLFNLPDLPRTALTAPLGIVVLLSVKLLIHLL